MKKFLTIARAEWLDAIQNYPEILLYIAIDLIPILMMTFVISRLTTYYILIFVINRLTGFYFENNLQDEIRRGAFSRYLLKPISLARYLFSDNIGGKVFNTIFLLAPILLILHFLYSHVLIRPSLLNFSLFVISLVFAFLINFFVSQLVAYASFFIDQAYSVSHLHWMLDALTGGYMLPLSFYPLIIGKLFSFLPFAYVYYYPASIYLGQFALGDVIPKISISASWTLVLFILSTAVWHAGIKKYSSSGG
jgi:ABC-2 type transport system permease protein